MNEIQHGKTHNLQKPFPGCLGRMVNLFDLSPGMAGNRLLTDKPHSNGFLPSSSRPGVTSSVGEQIEDRVMVSELRRSSSNRKSNESPMKMLIAQDVPKEVGSKQNPPSVVAKLMGLDTLPQDQPAGAAERHHSRGYLRSYSCMPLDYWQQEQGSSDMQIAIHQYSQQNECKDVYDIWPQSRHTNYVRNKSPQKKSYNDNLNEKKMALVRQKFTEAKHLATDDKLRHSKQFQDALEVLSSNKDIFIKFLQEPNSLFSQNLYNLQSNPSPSEAKRITVLKPCKMVNNEKFVVSGKKNGRQIKKSTLVGQLNGRNNPGFSSPVASWKVHDDMSRPTQIVVLKPSPGKSREIKAVISPSFSSPSSTRIFTTKEFYGKPENEEAQESREEAMEITHQMQESLSRHQRDETLISSVFSNGYIGDESSFNKSVNDCVAEISSDSEDMSPASRYSWDYTNRFGSPYSLSSFSRVSCSPESFVCREAKKRLSERWAMVASNGSCHEQRYVGKSSSTLGEMLALSNIKKSVRSEEEDNNKERESKDSTSFLTDDLINEEGVNSAPWNLLRSKSVPASLMKDGTRLNVEVSNYEVGKANLPNEVTKARSTKSLFKGKISSLFFSRNKKSGKDKSSALQSRCESPSAGMPMISPGKTAADRSPSDNDVGQDKVSSLGLHGLVEVSSPDLVGVEPKQSSISSEAGLSMMEPVVPGSSSENQDQPSPISVLEPLFGEDDQTASESSSNVKPNQQELLVHPSKCKLINKSSPIGSIASTLSWDESSDYFASSYTSEPTLATQGAEEDEQEWFFFVQTLLSAAGLNNEVPANTFMVRWHSPESPLDPSLRNEHLGLKDRDMPNEAKRRQSRSTQKLVFDCVNAALVEIARRGSETCQRTIPYDGAHHRLVESASFTVMELVWARIKEGFSREFRCESDCEDSDTLLVERVVRKETVGGGWVEQFRLEMNCIQKEVERKLLEELVQETLLELSGRV